MIEPLLTPEDVAVVLLVKAGQEDREAKMLGMPNGSAAHMRANIWRHAAVIACPEAAERMLRK